MIKSLVLVTTNEHDTRSPARDTVAGVALFTTESPGARVTDTTPADEPADTVRAGAVPSNGVGACPDATAVPVSRAPRSISACTDTYDPAHVNVALGAND